MLTLLSNSDSGSHWQHLKQFWRESDEINIAVAFLRQTGLELLKPELLAAIERNASITLIAGLDYGLTDSHSLNFLYKQFEKHPRTNLYLAQPSNTTFHTKLYCFKTGKRVTIVCGSANFTAGGLRDNEEFSFALETTVSDPLYHEVKQYFQRLLDSESVFPADMLSLKKYESFFNRQKKTRNTHIRRKPSEQNSLEEINTNLIKKLFAKYMNDREEAEDLRQKKENYPKARKVLDIIAADDDLNKEKFTEYYTRLVSGKGIKGLWHSGSLHRLKEEVFPQYKKFQKLVRFIKENHQKSAEFVFEGAMGIASEIYGLGVNVVTEIMTTYNPREFSALNNNPLKSLKKLGISLKSKDAFNGQDYQEFCNLLKDLTRLLELNSQLEIDHFFNYIYWLEKQVQ